MRKIGHPGEGSYALARSPAPSAPNRRSQQHVLRHKQTWFIPKLHRKALLTVQKYLPWRKYKCAINLNIPLHENLPRRLQHVHTRSGRHPPTEHNINLIFTCAAPNYMVRLCCVAAIVFTVTYHPDYGGPAASTTVWILPLAV